MKPTKNAGCLLLLATLSVAGCTGVAGTHDSATGSTGPESSVTTGNDPTVTGPLLLGAEERWTLREAHNMLVARCMQAAGFDGYRFEPSPFPKERLSASAAGVELHIAPPDQETFGLTATHSQQQDGPPADSYFEGLSSDAQQRYTETLFGSGAVESVDVGDGEITRPSTGCMTESENSLYQSEEYFLLDSRRATLLAGLGSAVVTNNTFQTLLNEYARCMLTQGFTAATPWDASELVSTRLADAGATTTTADYERTVAIADRKCQKTIGYASRARALHASVTATMVEQNPGLEQLGRIEREAHKRALALLSPVAPD